MVAQCVCDFRIDKGQEPGALVDQGDAYPERGEDAGVFAADDAGPDHRQGPRQPIELEDVVAGEDPPAVERDTGVAGGFRPRRDHDPAGRHGA